MIPDGPLTWYQLEIAYRYAAGGRPRRATCIRLGYDGRETDPARARAILERYPVGAPVTVYYDPRRPWEAALEPRVEGVDVGLRRMWAVFWAGIALLFASVG